MPASISHIRTNLDRIRAGKSDAIKAILREARTEAIESLKADGVAAKEAQTQQVNAQRTWALVLEKAVAQHVADELPGTNGRVFAKAYRDEAKAEVVLDVTNPEAPFQTVESDELTDVVFA